MTPTALRPFPPFPFELDQLVFEEAASADVKSALALSLVSSQIQLWSGRFRCSRSYLHFIFLGRSDKFLFRKIVLRREKIVSMLEFMFSDEASTRLTRCRAFITAVTSGIVTYESPAGPGVSSKDLRDWGSRRITPLVTRGCPNLTCLSIQGQIPRSVLEISLPSLTRLNCGFTHYRPEDFSSPFFQSVRYLQPNKPSLYNWDLWTSGCLRNMRSLAYIVLWTSTFHPAILSSLPINLELVILIMDTSLMEQDPEFEDLRTGISHPRAIPCFPDPAYCPSPPKEWVMTTDLFYNDPHSSSVDPEPFWDRGVQIVRDRMARDQGGGQLELDDP